MYIDMYEYTTPVRVELYSHTVIHRSQRFSMTPHKNAFQILMNPRNISYMKYI